MPTEQSVKKLQEGLKNWISIVELEYGVKPILYSSDSFYSDFLKQHFSDYPLWVANYNWVSQPKNKNWIGWQFSDKAIVKGINLYVDLNIFKSEVKNLILK